MPESTILPGRTIGILGGGQLGRMFAIAGRRMGYRIAVFDPTPNCPAGQLADFEVNAPYADIGAALNFADQVDVVTFEFENVPPATVAAIAAQRPVHPSSSVLEICCHRIREKTFLAHNGFPVTPFREVRSAGELRQALVELGTPAILKTADFGYDGKGQVRINDAAEADQAWSRMGRPVGILEALVQFDREISVICARTHSGQTSCFVPVHNIHTHHILDVTLAPAALPPATAHAAQELARGVADKINLVGLIAVEMFLVGSDKLLVNELAPRPHNSGHFSFDACVTSQFEQHLRAVCGLPLGDPSLLKPAAMANLLGDLWEHGEPDWAAAAQFADVKLHLYGKDEARPGRKMGHLTAVANTPEEAAQRVTAARAMLTARYQ